MTMRDRPDEIPGDRGGPTLRRRSRYEDPRIASQRWRYRADSWITHALDALVAARFVVALVILVALLAVMVGWLVAGLA